ncbi:MAG: exodeoxyribonuclease V subunit gamma [Planctomycetes bacterium]|nr:exodeoxyribonuclease V subunit gamma [Planctomycetota bacterium]
MMKVVVSSRMEELAAALVDHLERERAEAGGDPFHAPAVVVSTASIRTHLATEIARRTGVAANLRLAYFREFLREPVPGRPLPIEVPDSAAVQALLVHELLEAGPDGAPDSDIAPALRYLAAGGNGGTETRERRAFQLAGRLARLFEEYALNRPDMIGAWREGRAVLADAPWRELETWQRALWRRVFGPGGRLERAAAAGRGKRRAPACALLDAIAAAPALPPRIHVFGFSYFAETYHRLLEAMARRCEVVRYVLEPCPDRRAAAGGLPLAELWGRAGREDFARLRRSALALARAAAEPLPGGAPTLLATLQRDLLAGTVSRIVPESTRDGSLRVLECPDIRREAEILAGEIWTLVQANPGLRFHEIAVFLPRRDLEAYQTHIASVFAETHDLPFTIVDVARGRGSRVVEAVEQLIALPFTRLTRPDVLRVLTHPAVAARCPDADPADWVAWCERTAILHGADRADHAGTYIDKDLFHWDQGLRRLALGAFMAGEPSGELRFYEGGGRRLRPEEVPSSSVASAAAFVQLARALLADVRWARGARLSLRQWAGYFGRLVSAYVRPAPDAPGEDEREIARCRAALAALAELDLEGTPVSCRVAADFALARLAELTTSRLAEGVVVSSLRPMRAIPFRAIFVAGLGESAFPAAPSTSPLDLRAASPAPGDVDAREQDRYLFLETLLSARERLTLSYVARDARTGERLQCSSVIAELLAVLEHDYVGAAGVRALRIAHPLRRYDAAYFGPDRTLTNVSPAARREAVARRLGEDFRRACRAQGLPVAELAELSPTVRAALAGPLGLPVLEAASPAAPPLPARVEVTLSQLRKFLLCPLQGWAGHVLGIREDEDEDALAVEDEAFAASRLSETVLLREALLAARPGGPTALEALAPRVALAEARGSVPTGLFGEIAGRAHRAALARWTENLAALTGATGLVTVRFGGGVEHVVVDEARDALEFDVGRPDGAGGTATVRVAVVGTTGPLTPDRATAVRPVVRGAPVPGDFAAGYVDQMVLAAAGPEAAATERRVAVLVAGPADAAKQRRTLPAVTRAEARTWLADVLADLLGGPHAYLLPIEWAEKVLAHKTTVAEATPVSLRELSSRFGPIRNADAYPRPAESEGRAMLARRFRHFPRDGG